MSRISHAVRRHGGFEICIDGETVQVAAGETVATALLATGHTCLRHDGFGRPRGLFCNMGTCCECMVTLVSGRARRSVRACLMDVYPDMVISTKAHDG
jgi:sarcosine oxidase subunit alpha